MVNFSANYSDISDLRLVNNCLKMTAYDVTGGNESKTLLAMFIDHFKIFKMINNSLFLKAKIGVYSPENEKFFGARLSNVNSRISNVND